MRSIPILIVSMGLFLACTSKPERPRLEIPDAGPPPPPAATCQEACDSNDDCGQATTDADGGVLTPAGFCCTGDDCGAKNRCVECLADSDCTSPDASLCLQGSCVGCKADNDCSGDLKLCNVVVDGAPIAPSAALNTCVECADSSACGDQRCNSYGRCSCAGDAQCTMKGFETCRDEGCVCSADSACPDGARKCMFGICVACAEDDDCTGDLDKCFAPDTTGSYCGCRNNDQCSDGTLCDAATGKCVACLTNDDCAGSPTGSVCTAAGSCGQCATDADCGEGVCNAGVCECTGAADCKSANTMPELKWVCE